MESNSGSFCTVRPYSVSEPMIIGQCHEHLQSLGDRASPTLVRRRQRPDMYKRQRATARTRSLRDIAQG